MFPRRILRVACVLAFAGGAAFALASDEPDAWPQFRGKGGIGVSAGEGLPLEWSTTDHVRWRIDVPGRGWSSPIVWGDRVYVSSAVSESSFKQPSPGIYGNDYAAELADEGLSDEDVLKRVIARDVELASEIGELRYMLFAIAVDDGRKLWEMELSRGEPYGGRHRKNTYASETPVTDGERVYVYFGNVGLFCVTAAGNVVWTKRWEPQSVYLDFGTASSPAIHEDRLYVLHDNQEDSFVAAVDKRTGREIWRREREFSKGMIRSGWSTPFVWQNGERTEIVTVGQGLAVSYSVDGDELWRLSGLSGQATPTPTTGEDILFVGTGSQGESNRPLFAIRPGGSGDFSLADGEAANESIVWHQPRVSAYTSSPLVYEGKVYVVNDNGILSVLDANTGSVHTEPALAGVVIHSQVRRGPTAASCSS